MLFIKTSTPKLVRNFLSCGCHWGF